MTNSLTTKLRVTLVLATFICSAGFLPQKASAFSESQANLIASAAMCNALLDTSDNWPSGTDYDRVTDLRGVIAESVAEIERESGESAQLNMNVWYELYFPRYTSLIASINENKESMKTFVDAVLMCEFVFRPAE